MEIVEENFLEGIEILDSLKVYASKFEKNLNSKTATESTYYPDFIKFLETIFPPKKGYLIQSESRLQSDLHGRIKPDITIIHNGVVLFYIEAKAPEKNIDKLLTDENSRLNDQINRYTDDGTQLLITDFQNLFLIKRSEKEEKTHNFEFKCTLVTEKNQKIKIAENAEENLKYLIHKTCEPYIKSYASVKSIIPPLAQIAKRICKKTLHIIKNIKSTDSNSEKIASQYLKAILMDFKNSIFKEEKNDEYVLFSDLFAQTIIYGIFSAWLKYCQDEKNNNAQNFSLHIVGEYLPFGSFLRDLFMNLKSKTPKEFKPIFKDLDDIFKKIDYQRISNTESLINLFYSDFLKEYDPKTSKERGVVYTPNEIVKFIVKGIDFMLINWLDMKDGIISKYTDIEKKGQNDRLRILDPAAGTMAFASGFLQVALEKFQETNIKNPVLAKGSFKEWVTSEFFPNMYSFEILMAPYVLGQIRTFLTLETLGITLNPEEYKLNSFLMNTLMTPPKFKNLDDWMFKNHEIGKEIKNALHVRDKKDIYIVMGNPPYNLSSQNSSEWINSKINDYKEGLNEKNLKILSDDYVKFLRFSQWKIEKVGKGVLGFITNSRFLEGQVFSIMRKKLRETFDYIYIVDLHGDMRKKESGNVFDIRVGVCISFMVRINNSPNKKAKVFYMDVPQDDKMEKFKILNSGFHENQFQLLPETPKNYFVPIDLTNFAQYQEFIPADQFFKASYKSGIMVGRDKLLVDVDKEVVEWNIKKFFDREFEALEEQKVKINDTKSWNKNKILNSTTERKVLDSFTTFQYRGFDFRHIAYERNIVEGHRMGYIDQISHKNPAITLTKSSRKKQFCTAFISQRPIEKCYMSVTDTAFAFLLNIDGKKNVIISDTIEYKDKIDEEDLFYYIYGILFSPTYRSRYDEFLRKDFPRIPLTTDFSLFEKMSHLGKELAGAHLLNIEISNSLESANIDLDKWKVGKYHYSADEECLYFDKGTSEAIPWIKGITPEMWEFTIGNNPQIEQYLKSRKFNTTRKWNTLTRSLNKDELVYLLKICSAIEKTHQILPKLNVLYIKIDVL